MSITLQVTELKGHLLLCPASSLFNLIAVVKKKIKIKIPQQAERLFTRETPQEQAPTPAASFRDQPISPA